MVIEFLGHLDIVPYPPPLYYKPWKSLSPMERQIIVLDDDGIVQSSVRTRSLPLVKRETRIQQGAIKQEVIDLGGGEQALDLSRMIMKRDLKEEPIELDDFPFASTIRRPSAKKPRIQQETINVDAIEHSKIKQVIDVDAIADNTIVLEKESTIKYDLTEIDDDVIFTSPFPIPAVKDEDFNDINMMKEVLPFVEADREEFEFYT
ncbi:predicted protein [Sclerotinia sclerotiorum 1980 UF-70]|uniref:Uncharacterized protein n=1 Tax=Sclerotinia sclerotiorum (strain ATCC 18683 / 1980 / Ss-1) TaxID=665079 RepID=A7EUH7_SCLS1|nr:predicted protein [Sclerotinia sclerotiorum 1980 UF-70]EDN93119.1 predicted protein [Sclerotinia sclerotiorum 1980 UF-70]